MKKVISISIDEELLAKLQEDCQVDERSLSAQIRYILIQHYSKKYKVEESQ